MTTNTTPDPHRQAICQHTEFSAHVNVDRMVGESGIRFTVTTRAVCKECGKPLLFDGYLKKQETNAQAVIE